MKFSSIVSSPLGSLSLQQILDLANLYLENARMATDPGITLVLCHDTETSLDQVKKAAKNSADKSMNERIATVYNDLGELLESQGHHDEAQAFYKKSEKWGGPPPRGAGHSRPGSIGSKSASYSTADTPNAKRKQGTFPATLPPNVFPMNVRPPAIDFKPPEPDSRLIDTPQLACCLSLLRTDCEPDDILEPTARKWLQSTRSEPDEQERLQTLATDVIRAFERDELKNSNAVTEVVYLAPVLESGDFRYLLQKFYSGIDHSGLLDIPQLDGLAQLVQGSGYIDADDLVKILKLLSTRLRDTHEQSGSHLYQLTLVVSRVLDAMADANVNGLNREELHEPLSAYLGGLKKSSDPYLVYQAAYAYQALLCVPDDETPWQATLRRTGKVIKGVSGLVSAVKGLDLNGFIDGLGNIQQGLAGVTEVVQVVKTAYEGAASLAESGQGFLKCLKEGLSFDRKSAWYPALRGADTLIRDGQLAEFRKLVCEAPCRLDPAFQWGVCQRLGDIASNPMWDQETRRNAVAFLGVIYRNDKEWGQQATVKQWVLNVLMQLSLQCGGEMQFVVEAMLQELQKHGDTSKQALYRACRETGPSLHQKLALPAIGSPSLLDRVQERPDVEGNMRHLRRIRLRERGDAVYIPPQAKPNLQAPDETRFPLMERVEEYLKGDQKVFLLLGDSGAGKSTFNRELEYHLWQSYKKTTGAIPLHISLPAIDKPEHDMIAKQLRRAEFTEPQIRELKLNRKFVLICDGYDESRQTKNLYTSNRLNEPGEWNAKMIISCRSEYVGVDYRDRFQPGDRNRRPDPTLFQEVVITPFSMDQVQDYITQYVSVHRPLWEVSHYKKALDLIPSLKELMKNPFLMSLSLEVLPRMVDPGHDLTATHITRVSLYDQFIEQWLERGKKRIGEKKLGPQARSAYESLIDEGFTLNGIDYLKKLCVAVYKEQGGQPVVAYSRYKDENSWKSEFFSRDEEKQLLREACPLMRSGNQHRFIHRSLLEYGLALAVFDPQDWKEEAPTEPALGRRGSLSSILSSDGLNVEEDEGHVIKQEPNIESPLVWRSFTKEPSVLQFLEERVQQEPLFKQQLLDYIEHSKTDKKWRIAASNAITVLVRAGIQFNCADLRGIQIPKADLSYGMFDSAQLQNADLRHADFRGAWLRQTNLGGARMKGVQFGELPFLKQESEATFSMYSPDAKSLVVGLNNGGIKVYSTSTWETEWTSNEHSDEIVSIVFSPTDHHFASSSQDSSIRLWDIPTRTCRFTLGGHSDGVTSIMYSPQGLQIASGSKDNTVRLWNVETGECCHILAGHTQPVLHVIYSPNGSQIASSSEDSTVRLWRTETGECSHILSGHSDGVSHVDYSAQGDQVVSAGHDSTVRLWNVVSGECIHVLEGHTDPVSSVKYLPKGNRVTSVDSNGKVRLWDIETGECVREIVDESDEYGIDSVSSIVYSPQGDLVAYAKDNYTVLLWDLETGIRRQTLSGHSSDVSSVAFSQKGGHITTSSHDMTIRLWDIGSNSSRHISMGHNELVYAIQISPKGDQLASCSSDMTARLWDVKTGTCLHVLRGHTKSLATIMYSPQGTQIATGSGDNTVRLWDVETGDAVHVLSGHGETIHAVAYSPQGNRLASGDEGGSLRLWDAKTGEARHVLDAHTRRVTEIAYSPKGDQLVSCSWDEAVRVWDDERGVCIYTLTGHGKMVQRVFYSSRGDQIVSASSVDVRLWDAETGNPRRVLAGHKGLCEVAYSPEGDRIVSGCSTGEVIQWDVETGGRVRSVNTLFNNQIGKIAYSPQGDIAVSIDREEFIRVWDVASGQCHAKVVGLRDRLYRLKWFVVSDTHYLATSYQDGSLQLWNVTSDGGRHQIILLWTSSPVSNVLNVTDTAIEDVRGLSEINKELLGQRGAVGKPTPRLVEASQKIIKMASVLGKLKAMSTKKQEGPVSTGDLAAKQASGPLLRELESKVMALFRDMQEQS